MMYEGVRVEGHPPERRKRSTVLAMSGCCCCCCLHAVGGLAGAAVGSIRQAPEPETLTTDAAIRDEEEIRDANRYAAKSYWLVLGLTLLGCAIAAAMLSWSEPAVGLLLLFFFFPAVQLPASLVTWLWIRRFPPPRKKECLSRLGRITLFAFVGALAGVLGLLISIFTMSLLK
jgi:hypothetical protein